MILLFIDDKEEFILRKSEEVKNIVRNAELFKDYNEEFVGRIVRAFEDANKPITIPELRELLKRPNLDQYSVVTGAEFQRIFPKIVLLTFYN